MRNVHVWWERTPEGDKREVRASKFGGNWRLQSKVGRDGGWVYHDPFPEMVDLRHLRELIWRKYQRKRASHDDVVAVDAMIERRQQAEDAGKLPRSPEPDLAVADAAPDGDDDDDND